MDLGACFISVSISSNFGCVNLIDYNLVVTWRVVLEQDDETGDWAAWCPELPGCASAGLDREDALLQIKEAILLYLTPTEITLERGAEALDIAV
jgi:predicted RNase H-like HicB family nuclease